MKIHIENDTQERTPRQHVLTRMTQALSRMAASPVTARVTFSDVNGPKGGADIRCALLVSLPGQPPIRAERAQTTARLAFDESYARAVKQLEHARERWQEASRRPKKYFAAKRLLGAALLVAAFPLYAFAAPPTSDLELKAKKKTTVVAPKPANGQAAKDAEAVKGTTERRRRVDEAVKRPPPSRPDGDLTGGIQSKGIQRELTK